MVTRVIETDPSITKVTRVIEKDPSITKVTRVIETDPSISTVTRVIEGPPVFTKVTRVIETEPVVTKVVIDGESSVTKVTRIIEGDASGHTVTRVIEAKPEITKVTRVIEGKFLHVEEQIIMHDLGANDKLDNQMCTSQRFRCRYNDTTFYLPQVELMQMVRELQVSFFTHIYSLEEHVSVDLRTSMHPITALLTNASALLLTTVN